MPRSREFDEMEALDKAMRLFWRTGYSETSVRDLVEHTGVAHAGLYAAFGDKRGLFEAALRKYQREQMAYIFGPMEAEDAGLAEINGVFEAVIEGARSGSFRNGCFLANTATEFKGDAGSVSTIVQDNFKRQVRAFRNALKNAIAQGDLPKSLDIKVAADSLTTAFYGLSTLTRAGVPTLAIENAARAAMASLR
ncbi:MAG: TetR/AcrR family transcriptional regulator [Phormidesmis sp.]